MNAEKVAVARSIAGQIRNMLELADWQTRQAIADEVRGAFCINCGDPDPDCMCAKEPR